jgi:hypothetical protein
MVKKPHHGRKRVAAKASLTDRLVRIFVLAMALAIGGALIYVIYQRLF